MASTQYKNTIQFSAQTKGSGYIYNVTPISSSTLIIDLNYSYNFIMNVYVGNSVKPTTTTLTPTLNGSVYTYDISGYSYIFIENVGNASYINSIKIA